MARLLVGLAAVAAIPLGWLAAVRLLAGLERRSPAGYYLANATAGAAGAMGAAAVLAAAWRLKLLSAGVAGGEWPALLALAGAIGALGGAGAAVRDRHWFHPRSHDPFGIDAARRILAAEARATVDERRRTAQRLLEQARARDDVLPPELEAYVRRNRARPEARLARVAGRAHTGRGALPSGDARSAHSS